MLDTLIELQRLKRLDRTGWTLRGLAEWDRIGSRTFLWCLRNSDVSGGRVD